MKSERVVSGAVKHLASWSGGKDSALAVEEADVEVGELLVTVGGDGRTSMHGLTVDAVEAQAEAMGLDLNAVEVPSDDQGYRGKMEEVMNAYERRGFSKVLFGDVHLEDVRSFRESNLRELDGLWPIWGMDVDELAERAAEDLSSVVVCAPEHLSDLVGREYDHGFVAGLPEDVDPLGENGEFHTYVYDAPSFDEPVDHAVGERVEKTLDDGTTYQYVDVEV